MSTKKEKFYLILFLVLNVVVIALAFTAGYFLRNFYPAKSDQFPVLFEALGIIDDNGLKDLPEEKEIEYGMIRGLVEAYQDPYTNFYEPPQHELKTDQLHGRYGGIGARIVRDSDGQFRLYPFTGSPAAAAGVLEGDILLMVEDLEIIQDTPIDDIQAAIRGPVGERVSITIEHAENGTIETIKIKREEFGIPSTTWNLTAEDSQVGIIHINVIADTTPDEVTGAIEDLQSRGAGYFILDLRNNYGGLVQAGVDTARLFLEDGQVLKEKYKQKPEKEFIVEKTGDFADLPLVILVNGGTASAAEIIAGALQGHDRADLIGVPTYGKDSIQLIFELKDGSSLHVTSAKWWIPDLDTDISETGLMPDIAFDDPEADDSRYIQEAIDRLYQERD